MGLATERRAEAPKGSDRVRALLDAVSGALDDVRFAVGDMADDLTPEEIAALAVGMFRIGDQLEVTEAGAVARFKQGPIWAEQNFKSAGAWLCHHGNVARAGANRRVRQAMFLRDHPQVNDELLAGGVSSDQVQQLMRRRIPMVSDLFDRDLPTLVDVACSVSVDDFRAVTDHWQRLALDEVQDCSKITDPDDPDPQASIERAIHAGRRVHLSPVGDIWRLDGELTAEAGAIVSQRLKEIEDELFAADHADAKAKYGDKTTLADLERDATQRRHDALVEMAHPTRERTTAQRPVVQAICDVQTLADGVAKLIDLAQFYPNTSTPPDPLADDSPADIGTDEPVRNEPERNAPDRSDTSDDMLTFRPTETGEKPVLHFGTDRIRDFHPNSGRIPPVCELDDGTPISPRRVAELALSGYIQHFLFDGPHTVVAVGNKQRLFTGKLREALILRDRTCTEPGCVVRARDCDAHHIVHHEDGGPTSEINGEMRCGFHHRTKHKHRPSGPQLG